MVFQTFQMVFFYKVYIGYIGGTLYSGNSSIGYKVLYKVLLHRFKCSQALGSRNQDPRLESPDHLGSWFLVPGAGLHLT